MTWEEIAEAERARRKSMQLGAFIIAMLGLALMLISDAVAIELVGAFLAFVVLAWAIPEAARHSSLR